MTRFSYDLHPREKQILFTIAFLSRLTAGALSTSWEELGNALYLGSLLSFALACILAALVNGLCTKYQCGLFDAVERAMGKWAATAVRILALCLSLLSARNMLITLSTLTTLLALPRASYTIVMIVCAVTALLAALCSLKALARYARLVAYIMAPAIVVIVLMTAANATPAFLFPLGGHGLGRILRYGLYASGEYFSIILIGALYNKNYSPRENSRALWRAVGWAGAISFALFLCASLSFPYTTRGFSPLFELLGHLSAGTTSQSFSAVFIFIWCAAFLTTLCTQYGVSALLLNRLAKGRLRFVPVLAAIAVFSVLLSLIDPQSALFRGLDSIIQATGPVLITLFALCWFVSCLKERRKRKEAAYE